MDAMPAQSYQHRKKVDLMVKKKYEEDKERTQRTLEVQQSNDEGFVSRKYSYN